MKKNLALFISLTLFCAIALSACAQTTVNTILSAGTTQAFKADAIPENDLNTILQAGLSATSAMNQQPWHFVVITNQDVMDEIAGSMSMGGAPGGMPANMSAGAPAPAEGANAPKGMPADAPEKNVNAPEGMPKMPASTGAKAALGDSPAAIVIYMNEGTSSSNASFDCGLATQNMVIAANALGYGTKIVSSPTMALNGTNHDALCEKLGVDSTYNAVTVLLLGYTDTEVDGASGASTRNTIEEKVSFIQ